MSELTLPARVALVGNPNSGKTALFNALTGSRQKVANYPGVTVERKEGFAVTPAGVTVRLIDLPGTYSLRARSLDEVVTRDIVLGRLEGEEVPRLLVCVADSTNLRVALRLALELRRTARPMILALNMFDIARHRGFDIDLDRLSAELGIPVVSSVAVRRGGTERYGAVRDTRTGGHSLSPEVCRQFIATRLHLQLANSPAPSCRLLLLGSPHRRIEGAAVEQQVLADDEAGGGAAQKGAGVAEFRRIADPAGRVRLAALGDHLLERDVLPARLVFDARA